MSHDYNDCVKLVQAIAAGLRPKYEWWDIGNAIWDVFSADHEVVDAQGVVYNFGTWRSAADLIAHALNEISDSRFNHGDFYMGSMLDRDVARAKELEGAVVEILERSSCSWRPP